MPGKRPLSLPKDTHKISIPFEKQTFTRATTLLDHSIVDQQQTTMMSSRRNNKRSLEGVDQLVHDLSGTGITKLPPTAFSTKDLNSKSLYSVQNVHSIFAAGLERRRRLAAQQLQLGYGIDTVTSSEEPPVKRRRFQRRNSKTPAMLFQSLNILPQDLFKDSSQPPAVATSTKPQTTDDDEDWDGGLEIAKQLVAHLKKRRASDASV